MSDEAIRVTVCRYPDRANLVLRFIDPVTGKQKTKSAGTADEGEAIGKAAVWQDELTTGRYQSASKMTWAAFRERHEAEAQSGLSASARSNYSTTFDLVEEFMAPARLRDITTEAVSRWLTQLHNGRQPTTVGLYARNVRAAMNWAKDMGFLSQAPKVREPKINPGAKMMKGRPIVLEEHERMLAAVPKVLPAACVAEWRQFLDALWWSGLRLSEALALSWDSTSPVAVVMQSGYRAAIRFMPEGQKGHRAELAAIAPEFAIMLEAIPVARRHGRVFSPRPSTHRNPGRTVPIIGNVISRIGKRAGVVVDEDTGKAATAHDYRRAFGTRWSKRVMPAVLKRLMRHKDIDTTLRYYVDSDAEDIATDLWAAYEKAQGNISGNSPQEKGRKALKYANH